MDCWILEWSFCTLVFLDPFYKYFSKMKRAWALFSCSAVPLLSVDCTSTTRLQCSNNKKPLYLATANRPSHAARPPVRPKPVAPAPNHTPPGGIDALQVSILIGTVPPPCGAPGSRRQEERTVLELIPARTMHGTAHKQLSRGEEDHRHHAYPVGT